jgi:phosphoglycerate transport regulatory protein PgtC
MARQTAALKVVVLSLVTAWSAAQAGTVSVLTSFPKELTEAYKKAFEAANPGIKIEILNKNTTASIAYIKELAVGQRPDVMWASAPDAFEVLARDKLLQAAPEVKNAQVPAKVGNYPINDPNGLYYGQALAGYGLMWNTRYMQANKVPAPREWADLTKPAYFGHVAISSPSRSGTTHLTVETILQGEGWEKGWTQMLQIAGNCAAVTDRSFAVPDGVNNGQYGVGMVIDFFGLAGKYSGYPVEFHYPSVTAVVPANIALISGGKNADEAKKFIAYTLSHRRPGIAVRPEDQPPARAAQRLVRRQGAGRLPRRAGDRQARQGAVQHRPLQQPLPGGGEPVRPDGDLPPQGAAGRHARHPRGRPQARTPSPTRTAASCCARPSSFAYSSLVPESMVKDEKFLNLFRQNKRDVEVAKQLTGLEELWSSKAKANYERARDLANQAGALAK